MKIKIYADEAWRWPLAGPLVMWLTMPLEKFEEDIFDDSKKLSAKKREAIFERLKELEDKKIILHSFWYASNKEIDKFWLSKCINISFKRALVVLFYKFLQDYQTTDWNKLLAKIQLWKKLNKILENIEEIQKYDMKKIINLFWNIKKLHWIIFDWNHDFWLSKDLGYKIINVIKWDARIAYVWAASIVAKVERDNYMIKQSKLYPNFWFEKHKWYWTNKHQEAIIKYWICPLHRESFLNNIKQKLDKKR